MPFALDPEVAEALAPMDEAATSLPEVGDVEGRRAFWEPVIGAAGSAQPMPDDVTTTDHHTTTSDGEQLTLRWYVKDGAAPGPVVVFFHGGGYIFGHIDLFDGPVACYVSASGVSMLSVEYRRAPEHPHPIPIEDAYVALVWLFEHASDLGVDRERIGVMGDSAGGGLRQHSRSSLASEAVRRLPVRSSSCRCSTIAPPHPIRTSHRSRCGPTTTASPDGGRCSGRPSADRTSPPTAAPARIEDAAGLPPAYIEVGQLDVFRDEDTAYATKLSCAGVPVEFHLHPGVPHEFDSIAFGSDVARRAVADRVRVLRSL